MENTIDITGANDIVCRGDYWQQINLDYFDISSPLAEGKAYEARKIIIYPRNKSEDKQYGNKDNGGGIYSENKYAAQLFGIL